VSFFPHVSQPRPATSPTVPVHVIEPAGRWVSLRLQELWEFRELLYFLVWREVKVRYKQTALGIAWAVIQPLFAMVVFSVFFGRLAGVPSDGHAYPVFAFVALLPWQLFAFALAESSNSVVANQGMVAKVYFPRLLLPLVPVGVALVDFGVAFTIMLVLLVVYGVTPGLPLLTLPVWIFLAVLTALSVGIWMAAINVRYRDVRYTIPFLTQIWLLASPVAYATSLVPERWRSVYALNPMVGVVDGFRWAVLQGPAPTTTVLVSAAAVVVLLASGIVYFRRMERTFVDVL